VILPACGQPGCQRLGIVHEGRAHCPDHLISVLFEEKEILAKQLADLQTRHRTLLQKHESREKTLDFEIASRAREIARGLLEKSGNIRLDLVDDEGDLTLQ
jgi:hypothetical protein